MKDISWYFKHFNIQGIADGEEYPGPKDMKTARRELKIYFADNFRKGTGIRWGIALKGSGELVGSAGLFNWNKKTFQVETGYDLDPRYSGQGIMTEAMTAIIQYAFRVMNVNRIEALVAPRNRSSERLVRRLGFHKEGTLREHDFYMGKLSDDYLFSLLKSDWRDTHRR